MATKTGRSNAGAAAGVLGQLAALAPTKAKPKAGKPSKWELPLTPEARRDAERWVAAKAVLEPVEKRVENAKNDFTEYALREMVHRLFVNKTKSSNPIVVLYKQDEKGDTKEPDHQFQITMTDKFKFRFPEVPEDVDARDHFVEVFVNLGLHPSDAENLVDNELDFNPITGFKTLTELLEGSYGGGREWIEASEDHKEAGRKFAQLLLWDGTGDAPEALTPEEKAIVVDRSPGLQVKAGFYDRVATYCRSEDQLLAIFKVIQPIIFPAYAKFAVSDPVTKVTSRKIAAAADILGTTTHDDDED